MSYQLEHEGRLGDVWRQAHTVAVVWHQPEDGQAKRLRGRVRLGASQVNPAPEGTGSTTHKVRPMGTVRPRTFARECEQSSSGYVAHDGKSIICARCSQHTMEGWSA